MNGRPLHARRESRGTGGLVIPGTARRQHGCPQPRTGTQLSGTPQQEANGAYTSPRAKEKQLELRVKEKQLELRLKDQRYLSDTLKLL